MSSFFQFIGSSVFLLVCLNCESFKSILLDPLQNIMMDTAHGASQELALLGSLSEGGSQTLVFEDFEQPFYSSSTWEKISGTAFGSGPAQGTLPDQQEVSGFFGNGLVNTYLPDDSSTGALLSRSFTINKNYIGFYVGGGSDASLYIGLIVDGQVVLKARGTSSEVLKEVYWDLRSYKGRSGRITIVDGATGPWGHINVDQIVFADDLNALKQELPPNPPFVVGDFKKIFSPRIPLPGSGGGPVPWYINDHTFVYGPDNRWHLFGITNPSMQVQPYSAEAEDQFIHASALQIEGPWTQHNFALTTDSATELHLWAPHVLLANGIFHMFYCGGNPNRNPTQYKIQHATSSDLFHWQRDPQNPLFVDGMYARDPFILKAEGQYFMYYTANIKSSGGNNIVARRSSLDLVRWNDRRISYIDYRMDSSDGGGGHTESPFILQRGKYFYLLVGPHLNYSSTRVLRSDNPLQWDAKHTVGQFPSHAPEVIQDLNGSWYVSHSGVFYDGLFLAPLVWKDGYTDYEPNTDRMGGDYSNTVVGSRIECKQKCDREANCKAWTFVKTSQVCWLKSRLVRPQQDPYCDSGIKL